MRVVVIGVGNPWRRDDGAGWAAVDASCTRLANRADLVRTDGDPARLIDIWADADLAVVVDAVRTGSAAGTVHRVDLSDGPLLRARSTSSSHGLGVDDAVHLGRALGRLPRQLIVFGVEGDDFGHGPEPGAAVASAVRHVADRVVATVDEALAIR
jgi:hydrogenase maturation protease